MSVRVFIATLIGLLSTGVLCDVPINGADILSDNSREVVWGQGSGLGSGKWFGVREWFGVRASLTISVDSASGFC